MSVVVEIINTTNLKRAKTLLGAKSDSETLEMALEKVVEDYYPVEKPTTGNDLPDEYWEDLFSQPLLPPSHSGSQAIIDERNEDRF